MASITQAAEQTTCTSWITRISNRPPSPTCFQSLVLMSLSNCPVFVQKFCVMGQIISIPDTAAEVSRWPRPLKLIQVSAPSDAGGLTLCPGGLSCLWWYEISFKVLEERLWYRPLCPSVRQPARQSELLLCYSGDLFSLWIPVWPLSCLSPWGIAAFIPHPLVFPLGPLRFVPAVDHAEFDPIVSRFFSALPSMQNPRFNNLLFSFHGCETWRIPDRSKSLGRHNPSGIPLFCYRFSFMPPSFTASCSSWLPILLPSSSGLLSMLWVCSLPSLCKTTY